MRRRRPPVRRTRRRARMAARAMTDAGYGGRLAPAGRTCARRPSVPVRQPDGANHRPDSGTGGTDADCATNRGTRRRAGHRTGKRPDGGANGRRRCRAHGFAHPAPPDCLTRPAVPSAAVPLAGAGKGTGFRASRILESISRWKRFASHAIRPALSRKNAVFPPGLSRAVLCCRLAFCLFFKGKMLYPAGPIAQHRENAPDETSPLLFVSFDGSRVTGGASSSEAGLRSVIGRL